jgi:hypothetical protein
MKIRIFTFLFIVLYTSNCAFAQIKTKKHQATNNTQTALSLNIQQQHISFDFTWFDDYVNGLGKYNGKYFSKGQITSNINWQLSCKAKSKLKQTQGNKTIHLNNIGISVYCNNMDGKVNRTLNTPIPLSRKNKTLLYSKKKTKTSKKDHKPKDRNKEISTDDISIFWEMGTRKGKMNKKNLHQQNIKKGAYSVDIEFILIEKL